MTQNPSRKGGFLPSRCFRGLLMPRVGVEHHGIKRTDVGHLGSGIYFTDAFWSVVRAACFPTRAAQLIKTGSVPLQHQFEVLAAQRHRRLAAAPGV